MIKTIFFGTPEICLPTVRALCDNPNIQLDCIVSMPNRKAGRGMKIKTPAVAQFALDHGIELIQTSRINDEEEFWTKKAKEEIDLIIVFAFAQFLADRILKLPRLGCFNIHTSLLPKYRGASPIQHALLNGDAETGVSIQKMIKKMDAGDVAVTSIMAIDPTDNASSLHDKLMNEAPRTTNLFIDQIVNDTLSFTTQDEGSVSFAPAISKKDGRVNFTTETFTQIHNRLRAFDPWPGIFLPPQWKTA